MASTHRFVTDWTPERFLSSAASIGENVECYIKKVLDKKQHPEKGYTPAMGILSLAKRVGNDRLIKACQRALGYGVYS